MLCTAVRLHALHCHETECFALPQAPGAVSGDVILHVASEEHEDFEREGSDLICKRSCPLARIRPCALFFEKLLGMCLHHSQDNPAENGPETNEKKRVTSLMLSW
jgi:hypothetical protein